jgi:hypothetical protein
LCYSGLTDLRFMMIPDIYFPLCMPLHLFIQNVLVVLGIVSITILIIFFLETRKKYLYLCIFILATLVSLIIILGWFLNYAVPLFTVFVAAIALFKDYILDYLFPPVLDISTVPVFAETRNEKGERGPNEKWLHVVVYNNGLGVAKNLRVKIRHDDSDSWLSLKIPFSDETAYNKLFVKDDEHFDIGRIIEGEEVFRLIPRFMPNDPRLSIEKDGYNYYKLRVVSENTSFKSYKVKITNRGYDKGVTVELVNPKVGETGDGKGSP